MRRHGWRVRPEHVEPIKRALRDDDIIFGARFVDKDDLFLGEGFHLVLNTRTEKVRFAWSE